VEQYTRFVALVVQGVVEGRKP